MDRTGEEQISLTDPDSRAMARMAKVGVGTNVQLAVDTTHKLIVEQEVHSQVVDMGLLAPTAEAAMEALGVEQIEVVADRGCFKIENIENIEACEAAGITAYVPKPVCGPAVRDGVFNKEAFRYDSATDTLACPGDQTLRPCRRGHSRDNVKTDHSSHGACLACRLRPRCTKTYDLPARLAPGERGRARPQGRPG